MVVGAAVVVSEVVGAPEAVVAPVPALVVALAAATEDVLPTLDPDTVDPPAATVDVPLTGGGSDDGRGEVLFAGGGELVTFNGGEVVLVTLLAMGKR